MITDCQEQKNRLRTERFHDENVIRELTSEIEESVERKNSFVRKLKIHDLQVIKVDNIHDKANDVFIWVIICVYFESEASYHWENFKKQVFDKDEGKDFV